MEDVIEHFSHKHPLKLQAAQESKHYKCYGCEFSFSSSKMYGCSEEECFGRSVYLCTLCAHLPDLIHNHLLHPKHDHTLHLVNQSPRNYSINWCDACGGNIPIGHECLLFYHCNECAFDLHAHCAHSLRPTLRYTAHDHLLTLVHTNYTNFYKSWKCNICDSRLLDGVVFVRCVQCKFNLHINCFQSADVDGHPSLPDATTKHLIQQGHPHPLTLVTDDDESLSTRVDNYFFCDACKMWDWPQRWVYKCMECNNFTSHLSCPIQFPPHSYSTFLYPHDHSSNIDSPQCQGCKKPILKGCSIYGCKDKCNLFLDDSCFQQWHILDKQTHPFHPQHPLKFMFIHGKQFTCNCCGRKCSGFIFHCQYCRYSEFVLDLECMLLVPSLQHLDHKDHLLVLVDNIATYYKTSYLRCVECREDFSLRKCLLPCIIQHKCHFHPLTLLPRLVDDEDSSQSYCDACEDKRDPSECIYYCRECKFEVHVGCVKFEVLGPSRNKLKDVKFVTIQQMDELENQEAKKDRKKGKDVFLLKDVLLPHNQAEVQEIKNVLKLASELTLESCLGNIPSRGNETTYKFLYSDQPFKSFVSNLNSVLALEETEKRVFGFLELEYEVVHVGEYLVPLNFEHIIEALFAKHGDFGAGCTLSPKIKKYLFLGFCKVLQSIFNTKIAQVKESLLIQWWVHFAIGQAAGFKIQFAFENLKRIVFAHFGLQADKYADGLITSARTKIRELPQEINALSTKIEELTVKLVEKRETLENVKVEESELRQAAYRAKKSHFMRKCLIEAEDLVCYSGGELFFPPTE